MCGRSVERKEVLRTLLSEIDPYTLKVGDLSGDLAVLPLPGYHYHLIITAYTRAYNAYQHLQSFSLLHLYSHGNFCDT